MMKTPDEIIRFLNEDGSWEAIKLSRPSPAYEDLKSENQTLRTENLALKESLKLIA